MVDTIEKHFDEEFKAGEKLVPDIKNTTDPNYKGSRSLTHKWQGMAFS